jgi:hypothetical protein|uniref:Uncharacterized protein n=1 Tax=viral metagenome TaxID=1070528 RepID=A0A6C0LIK3_9ZZZZ
MNTENEDLGFIKITYDNFRASLDNFNNSQIVISDNIANKANDLINNYNCFVSNYDARSLWEKKKIIASNKTVASSKSRPHIIYVDFSDETKCKKEFISYLNKLTDLNKDIIYNKISVFISKINDEIKTMLFDVLINFIKSSNNNIYIDVLYLFDDDYIKTNITRFYNNYLNQCEWLPKEIKTEYKNIFDEENYDIYCEYVKIKKTTLSIIKALCLILKKLDEPAIIDKIINNIFNDLNEYIFKSEYKHLTELLLDELAILIENVPTEENINNINMINTDNLDNSTKFKINNIVDRYK